MALYSPKFISVETKAGSGEPVEKKADGPFMLVYNDSYCGFYTPVRGWVYFQTVQRTTQVIPGGTIEESFLNEENETVNFGHYYVMIFKAKAGAYFEIAMPGGTTYYTDHAELYSPNGRVATPYITNWKDINARLMAGDSLARAKDKNEKEAIARNRRDDSLFFIQKDSLAVVEKTAKLEMGQNFNHTNIKWLADTVSGKVKADQYFYSDFNISIDRNGIITGAAPTRPVAPAWEKYVELVNKAVVGQKTTAFIASDGKPYPSYANVYVMLDPTTKKGR